MTDDPQTPESEQQLSSSTAGEGADETATGQGHGVKTENPPAAQAAAGGPLNLAKIRELRKSQQAARPIAKKRSVTPGGSASNPKDSTDAAAANEDAEQKVEVGVIKTPPARADKVAVPSRRDPLSDDLEDELQAALGGSDLDSMLVGDKLLQVGHMLDEGQRMQAKVVKVHGEHVFVSLGGPNEGTVPVAQFNDLPEPGSQVEVVVRGYNGEEGLYELTLPGNAVEVSDWDDINEGEVIEVNVTGSNTGGLECKVGAIRGFIPASQVAEYRVENLAEMVGQKVLCVVTEANPRRGNLVLSRRAVLEREKAEKRTERLAALSVGDSVDGTVTKIMDFGAFVDIGGLDGLLHISQLSWERVKHPSEVLEQGQKVKVRVEKIDPQSGKIGLSYRSMEDHPWLNIDARFPVSSVVKGTVTRIAEFGAFVRVATGVEGLVHISELAHHRVSNVSNVVEEGQEVEVKILSIDTDSQRMSLSIKGALAAPESAASSEQEDAEESPPPKPILPKHKGPLKGGTDRRSGGEQFGLKW